MTCYWSELSWQQAPNWNPGLLEVLLAIGNHLNAGGCNQHGSAIGFRIDEKFGDVLGVRRADGRWNLLRFAVGFILSSKNEAKHASILDFPRELAGLGDAAAVRALHSLSLSLATGPRDAGESRAW